MLLVDKVNIDGIWNQGDQPHCEECDTKVSSAVAFREDGAYDMPPFVVCFKCLRKAMLMLK